MVLTETDFCHIDKRNVAQRDGKEKMKVKLLALCAFLSVATVFAQQKYMLPIGSNVNSRPMTVNIGLGNSDTGWAINDLLNYTPAMGDFEKVVQYRVSVLASQFDPPVGSERDPYVLQIIAEPGPYTVVRFRLDQSGAIPPEVLEVKLQYGEVTLKLDGVTKVELRVRGNGREERFSSDGSSQGSVCFIQTVDRELGRGLVILAKEYVNPQYRASWITEGEVILWENERFAEFNILDGKYSSASAKAPDFMESIRAPEMSAQPRIASIKRSGNTTELTVSADHSISISIEFSETLGGSWYSVPKYLQPLSLQTGSTTFTHTTDAPASFYRLRVNSSSPQ